MNETQAVDNMGDQILRVLARAKDGTLSQDSICAVIALEFDAEVNTALAKTILDHKIQARIKNPDPNKSILDLDRYEFENYEEVA